MAFLTDDVINQVQPLLEELENTVELKVFTGSSVVVPGQDATGHQTEALGLLRELEAISDNLTVTEEAIAGSEEAKAAGITRAPTIVFRRQGDTRTNLRFAGLPSGYEFTTVLEAVRMVASNDAPEDKVGELSEPTTLQTFVTPGCPYCPQAVITAFELALANESIIAEGVEANEYPVLSQSFGISSVPDTIIGGRNDARLLGAQPKRQFVEAVQKAAAPAAV